MKFFAIIFSVIVMGLAIVPCCAYDCCKDEHLKEPETNKSKEAPCSPLISCSCSTGVCVSTCVQLSDTPEVPLIPMRASYTPFCISAYISSIWQPPKHSC